MQSLLEDFGQVEVERQLAGEVRTVDVVFHPAPDAKERLRSLGMLGQMVSQVCLIEPFRKAVPEWEIRNCREKLFRFESELLRLAKREKRKLPKSELSFVWILSPTISPELQQRFCVVTRPDWCDGIYFLPVPIGPP